MPKLLKDLWSFTMMVLVILGIGGLVYNLIREGGWLSKMFGAVTNAESRHSPLILVPLVAVSIWIAWLALNGKLAASKGGGGANLLVWPLAAFGAYVLIDWLRG